MFRLTASWRLLGANSCFFFFFQEIWESTCSGCESFMTSAFLFVQGIWESTCSGWQLHFSGWVLTAVFLFAQEIWESTCSADSFMTAVSYPASDSCLIVSILVLHSFSYLIVVWQLFISCQTAVCQLTIDIQLFVSCQTAVCQLTDSCLSVVRQLFVGC